METGLPTPPIKSWESEAELCRKIRQDSIPKQWLLPEDKLPSGDRLNVIKVPFESGILSEKELEITESDAIKLTDRMGSGTWTAEEVIVSFLKRATLGQQLASEEFIITRKMY